MVVRVARHNYRVRIPGNVVPILNDALGLPAATLGWTVNKMVQTVSGALRTDYNCCETKGDWPPGILPQGTSHPNWGEVFAATYHGVQIGHCVNHGEEIITLVGAGNTP
ncbi:MULTISPECIES: hypothetical protein [Rhodobacterales]|uniref:hypothetical protein n=1 Tax=Rhodobacterales TaxID=204455 RepID=UPI001109299D|nr:MULTISPECIES: hypothetical protein [Rhodobacterales]